jgi:hypothetical protein
LASAAVATVTTAVSVRRPHMTRGSGGGGGGGQRAKLPLKAAAAVRKGMCVWWTRAALAPAMVPLAQVHAAAKKFGSSGHDTNIWGRGLGSGVGGIEDGDGEGDGRLCRS